MRAVLTRDRGVNLAYIGANEIYRRIRFGSSPLGPDRIEINYRNPREDPRSPGQGLPHRPNLALTRVAPVTGPRARYGRPCARMRGHGWLGRPPRPGWPRQRLAGTGKADGQKG